MIQLMHSFNGVSAAPAMLDAVRRGDVAAFCLFSGINVDGPAQLRQLNESLWAAAQAGGHPVPLIGIDQEGGQLIAIRGGATELPGNLALGATRSEALAEAAGRVLGRELLAMGITLNFAPCIDILTSLANPAMGVRTFGDDPALTSRLGAALIRGMQDEGVLATAKHYPGMGRVTMDSHYDLPVVPDSREEIENTMLRPFRAAIEANVGAIMTAHALYPALDPDVPATLSPKILQGVLRQHMGFEGLILTDALDMGALTNQRSDTEIIEQAMNAGVDMLLLGHLMNRDQLPLISITQPLLNPASVSRIRTAQARVGQVMPSLDVVGSRDHQKIVAEIAQKAITLARDTESLLPLRLSPEARIAVVTAQPVNLTPADTSAQAQIGLADAIRQRHGGVQALQLAHKAEDTEIRALVEAVRDTDVIIVGTLAADADPVQQAFIKAVQTLDLPVIVVALRTPYEVAALPNVGTILCTYSLSPASVEAAAMVLFGELTATGHLPVKL